ncbi:PH domain-containing protein [Herbiconiux sp.]|uniref:PH domain-containing protein n=1 Tax=Herbiconiux sp. TaxID=1871186 RepID=UPI0025C4AE20|nr:PH domain-containing protein [Herbiconiux sp.]
MSGAPEVAGTGKTGRPDLVDGEWHRLHPATPLLRGGIALIAVLGFALANFRERAVELVFGGPVPDDPFQTAYERGHLGWVGLALVVGLLVGIAGFYASWRMHTFRVGDDVVEVRSGIMFRTHRRARLDRIQGVSIARPLFARIFGAAKLDISVAGQDAKVQLSYLGSADADRLRREVLLLASGVQQSEAEADHAGGAADPAGAAASLSTSIGTAAVPGPPDGIVHQRVRELLAPELDPSAAPPESVVRIPPGRLIGSLVLSGFTVALLVVGAIVVVASVTGRQELLVIILVPGVLAAGGYYFNRFTKSLRYSIAGTSDGVRIGYGLLSTSNDTLPPGRIHAVEVSQPLLWRAAGWWMIRINRAGAAGEGSGQTSTTMLPVGTVDDVRRVLGLLLPGLAGEQTRELVLAGLVARKGGGFSAAPRRSWPYQPLSWRRTGSAVTADAVLLRSGFVWRHLSIVPFARVQSLRLTRRPLHRALRLSELTVHTVAGPVRSNLSALDAEAADESFEAWARAAVRAAAADTAHRWASHPALTDPAPDPEETRHESL